jgi:MGT family glycosyltransferase
MRFLFCPLAGHGYVYPMIGIAQALRKRGHSAAFVTGPDFGDTLAKEGMQRIPLGKRDKPSFEIFSWTDPLAIAKQILHVEFALKHFLPDVIVTSHLAFGPLIAGERHNLPTGVLGFATYLWPTRVGIDDSPHSKEAKHQEYLHRAMTDDYNRARQTIGLSLLKTDAATEMMLGYAFLVQSVPELERDFNHLPTQVHLVGSCVWEPEENDNILLEWLAEAQSAKEPIIYVQHGRLFHLQSFWPFLVDSLKNKSLRVVATVGRTDTAKFPAPANFLVCNHAPQGPVFARAVAAVLTGNTTSVLGALLNGVPMLLTPGGGEQPVLARRCAQAGAAVCVEPTELALKADFAQALERILSNTALRNGAQRIKQALRSVNGPERVADILEHVGRHKRPITRSEIQPTARGEGVPLS